MKKKTLSVLVAGLVCNVLAHAGWEDLGDPENWTARIQHTYVHQKKLGFSAADYPAGSLIPGQEPLSITTRREPRSYTFTTTAFLGVRPWQGAEVFYNPEMSMGQPMSMLDQGLGGLGGLANGENQKNGGPDPIFYNARFFLRQTWNLGEATEEVEPEFNVFGGKVARERIVLTVGKIAVSDIFDDNAFAHDPRSQFFNWALMAGGAYDYAADSRGYSKGVAIEYFKDAWEFRYGRFMMPKESNGLKLDSKLLDRFGEQFEVVHNHEIAGRKGAVRALVYRNHMVTGNYRDAVAAGSPADLSAVRRLQNKRGFGINMDQMLTGDLGMFARYSQNDGRTETYAFAEIDRSLSAGLSMKGTPWGRAEDNVAVAYVINNLSRDHREFLAAGGTGVFVGGFYQDQYRPEKILESYYNVNLGKFAWLSLDYQHITNPAYNPDRGPINIYGARLHVEY